MESKINTYLAVLGGGPAGYVAAIRASQLGVKVVLIEESELGGVCLNKGCIPTKALLKTAESYKAIKNSKEFGISSTVSDLNWNVSNDRKNRVVKNLNMGLEHLLPSKGIIIIKGKGSIKSPKKILVLTSENEVEVNCEKMIISTGSKPLMPNIPGIDSNGVITSNEALNLKRIPESIAIVGAGAIGLEFATMFNSLGSKVTVIEIQNKILPNEDNEISTELLKIMKRQGINFKLSSFVNEIKVNNEELELVYSKCNKEASLNCKNVLLAAGRKLNSDCFRNLSLDTSKGAIVVDKGMETSIKGVYAAGDIVGGKLLAHLAFMEGKVAAENTIGIHSTVNYSAIPSCVYTNPEIASVGINEEEALRLGLDIKVGRFNFRNNGRALCLGEREGFVKIIADENNTLIGGQILCVNASELISEITLAITLKAKVDDIADMIHPHPTLSEAIWEACADAIGRSIHKA